MSLSKVELDNYVKTLDASAREHLRQLLQEDTPHNLDLAASMTSRLHTKLATFSGEDQPGDVSFSRWRHDINCMIQDKVAEQEILKAIRMSVRGVAAGVLQNLREDATVREVMGIFDETFGNARSLQSPTTPYNTSQQLPFETVMQWGWRLEDSQKQIADRQGMNELQREDMLRERFWSGLYSEEVKAAIRPRYENGKTYSELLSAARSVEDEIQSKATGHPTKSSLEEKVDRLLKQMEIQDRRISALHEKVGGQQRQANKLANGVVNDCPESNFSSGSSSGQADKGRGQGQASSRQCNKRGSSAKETVI